MIVSVKNNTSQADINKLINKLESFDFKVSQQSHVNNIILIEKMDILSGNGKYDMNFYDLINSEAQRKAGVEDSVEKLIADNSNHLILQSV